MANADTIAAIATAAGRAGIGVVRVSGPDLSGLATRLTGGTPPPPRVAKKVSFRDAEGNVVDQGILIYFKSPASFTGEDVLELQGHGGDAVLNLLMGRCLAEGARIAQPGEFTQRAFFNHKIDLAQVEAIADVIEAESASAVRSAMRSLTGEFSQRVNELLSQMIDLRLRVEGSIDFSDEGITFLEEVDIAGRTKAMVQSLGSLLAASRQGALQRSGRQVVLIGAPNVGKSSLLNAIAEEEHAIVTDVPGTTRDTIRSSVLIEGIPFHLIDTAGIRDTADVVEQAGIQRTWDAIDRADLALIVVDAATGLTVSDEALMSRLPSGPVRFVVCNKVDLLSPKERIEKGCSNGMAVSAKTGEGLAELKAVLLRLAGWEHSTEAPYLARERHLSALRSAHQHLEQALLLTESVELMAEELRIAQNALSTITGEFSSDDLLGEIFSRFCIGK
jgi:tRNA modification GTPase